ncbi:TetR/AcrR family transcriptional regulator [Spirillospora sp. NPDC047418]|jgi:AcrR family transcriptional regulator
MTSEADGLDAEAQDSPRLRQLIKAAEDIKLAVRRQDGRETPVGTRAMRTRGKLLEAAARLFTERGYLNTSLNDVAQDAGVSLPTIYQYFADRNDIVATLAADHALRMLQAGADDWKPTSGRLGLRRAIAALVTLYAENSPFFSLWQVASHVDERLADLRRDFENQFQSGFARKMRNGIELGVIRPDLDPVEVSRAMNLMVQSYCHDVFVVGARHGAPAPEPDDVIDLLTTLWADAIGLQEHPATTGAVPGGWAAPQPVTAAPSQS